MGYLRSFEISNFQKVHVSEFQRPYALLNVIHEKKQRDAQAYIYLPELRV